MDADVNYNYFNPRSYKRSDYFQQILDRAKAISIHAPTRGATMVGTCSSIVLFISIHAPTRGATLRQRLKTHSRDDFNPRSYKRSDARLWKYQELLILFQSTLLQEERQQKCTIILILICNNYCIVSIKSHQHYNNYFM